MHAHMVTGSSELAWVGDECGRATDGSEANNCSDGGFAAGAQVFASECTITQCSYVKNAY